MGRLGTDAVYASSGGSPRQDARLASGCWPDSTGWALGPLGSSERFLRCFLHRFPPFPGLPWRKRASGPTSMRKPLSRPGARRVRDFPNIHSASPAQAGRHERVMRLLPFTPAASPCAMSDPGMPPESRPRSGRGTSRTSPRLSVRTLPRYGTPTAPNDRHGLPARPAVAANPLHLGLRGLAATEGLPPGATPSRGYWARATFSCQTVPRFSSAHITRTR